jgi:hypothetical protein
MNPGTIKPSAPEEFGATQEKSEKTQSRPEDKSEDVTGSREGVKPAVSTKKKFPFEED